ncbi:MAG: hypothetical protein OHK0054_05350 [Sideroxydans sp.]
MSERISLTRAARLVGVPRTELQRRIKLGDMPAQDGQVLIADLLACYPEAQLEDDAELRRIEQIKEKAFGKRVYERALPEPEVLAARLTELGKTLAIKERQLKAFNGVFERLWNKLEGMRKESQGGQAQALASLREWIRQEVEAAMEPGSTNPLAVQDNILRIMAAQVTLLPSGKDFLVEGQDTLLESAMRAGLSPSYGCSGGNCGLCKARVVSGQVKQTRHHDFVIREHEKQQGYILLCSNTAVTDLVLEASTAEGVQDIPFQQIETRVKSLQPLTDRVMLLHLQTPRSQRLRFLAGQGVTLRVGQAFSAELPIASCPCDDRNLLFHVHAQPGNLFADYLFERLRPNDTVSVEGPTGAFILHEQGGRPLYFFAFDGGFAPIKSLIEHALSREIERIRLSWIGSTREDLYLPNIGRAWSDALDNVQYSEEVAGFNLRTLAAQREAALLDLVMRHAGDEAALRQGDIYLAGPAASVAVVERHLLALGLPKTRVFVFSSID